MKTISIIVPCFNEEDILAETLSRLQAFASAQSGYRFELIFVDDGSSDHTLELLRTASVGDPSIRVLSFSRNFGHQIAVTAGIDAAAGDAVALIDADLQDPPEILEEMIQHWQNGYHVVYGVRRSREGETGFKLVTARVFYRLLNRLSEVPVPLDTGDFRLMDRRIVDILREMPERHRFIRGMVAWVGFNQKAIPYDRKRRAAGVSKYPFRRMVRFAVDGIISFSSRPLHLSTNLGLIAAGLALIGIIYAVALRLLTSVWVEGWTALMIAVLFMGGVQLIAIGVIGEYVGRIYEESKRRPLYAVKESLGFDPNSDTVSMPEVSHAEK
ncbi:glycosyltransferase [Rhodobacterales bacterium FZCC0069]|nr:glycosyltransferase [Rhodobacterales bacterium FZCC0069]